MSRAPEKDAPVLSDFVKRCRRAGLLEVELFCKDVVIVRSNMNGTFVSSTVGIGAGTFGSGTVGTGVLGTRMNSDVRARYLRLTHDLSAQHEHQQRLEPPGLAEVLLSFCARTKHQRAALGDLSETYVRNCGQFGRARANRLYWAEALRSLAPLLGRMVGRFVKWAVVVDWIKHHLIG